MTLSFDFPFALTKKEKIKVHNDVHKKSQDNSKASIFYTFFEEIHCCFGHIRWKLKVARSSFHISIAFCKQWCSCLHSKLFPISTLDMQATNRITPCGKSEYCTNYYSIFYFLLHLHYYAIWSGNWETKLQLTPTKCKNTNRKFMSWGSFQDKLINVC